MAAAPKKAKKAGYKASSLYKVDSNKIERKNKFCPKCGPGMFMGNYKNRWVCGKCRYVEYNSK